MPITTALNIAAATAMTTISSIRVKPEAVGCRLIATGSPNAPSPAPRQPLRDGNARRLKCLRRPWTVPSRAAGVVRTSTIRSRPSLRLLVRPVGDVRIQPLAARDAVPPVAGDDGLTALEDVNVVVVPGILRHLFQNLHVHQALQTGGSVRVVPLTGVIELERALDALDVQHRPVHLGPLELGNDCHRYRGSNQSDDGDDDHDLDQRHSAHRTSAGATLLPKES